MRAALVALLVLLAGCAHARTNDVRSEAQTVRAEGADVERALKHVPHAQTLVESYHIEGERLSVSVDASAWTRLGRARQDAFKKSMWEAWSDSYTRRRGPTRERIFFSVYDLLGNDLGSYFGL